MKRFVYLQGFNELEKKLKFYGICIAISEKLLKDSGVPSQGYYDDVVRGLMAKTNAMGKLATVTYSTAHDQI